MESEVNIIHITGNTVNPIAGSNGVATTYPIKSEPSSELNTVDRFAKTGDETLLAKVTIKSDPLLRNQEMKNELKSESADEDNAKKYEETDSKKKPSISTTTACIYCKSIFSSQKKYIEHVAKDHRGKKPFKCKICSVGVVRLTSLREHMNKHTNDRPFQCLVCYDVFSHKKALSRHRELHMLPPTVAAMKKCRRCREEFHSEEQYNVHKSVCAAKVKYSDGGPKAPPDKKTKPIPGERPFICTVCGMGLSRLTSLNEHMNTHTGEKPFVCTLCGERFLNSKALLRHRDKHDSKNPKCCRKCKHEFENWEEFRTHVNQMACQVKLSTCHVCQETFTRVIDFETHYKFCHASEQKLYSCGQCGKKLSHKSHLNAHVRTHDSQAAVCATCGRQFVGETQLKRHIATAHTEPKCPYKCPVCQMGMSSLAVLIEHTKTHITGDEDDASQSYIEPPAVKAALPVQPPQITKRESVAPENEDVWRSPPPPTVPPIKIKLEKVENTNAAYFDDDDGFQNYDDDSPEEDYEKDKKTGVDQLMGDAPAVSPGDDNQVNAADFMEQAMIKLEKPIVKAEVHDNDDDDEEEEEKVVKKKPTKRASRSSGKSRKQTRRPRNFPCDECGKKFDSNHKLNNHSRVHTKESPYECYLCGLKMRFYGSLKGHMYRHLNVKPIQCDFIDAVTSVRCNQKFKRKEQLMVHLIKHTGVKPWLCQICGKGYATEKILEKHRKIHGEAVFKCPICDRGFTQKFKVPLHMKTHSDQPSYVCHECGAPFRNRWSMQQHMKRHINNVIFKCKYCDKQFVLHSALSAHMRSHTGEKGYSCSTCHKVFTKTRALKMHERLHTGEKPFKCDWPECPAAFRMKITLSTHYRIHTGEKPYPCKYCEKEFTTSSNLARHLDAMHEQQVLADAGIENAVCTGTKLGMEIAVVD